MPFAFRVLWSLSLCLGLASCLDYSTKCREQAPAESSFSGEDARLMALMRRLGMGGNSAAADVRPFKAECRNGQRRLTGCVNSALQYIECSVGNDTAQAHHGACAVTESGRRVCRLDPRPVVLNYEVACQPKLGASTTDWQTKLLGKASNGQSRFEVFCHQTDSGMVSAKVTACIDASGRRRVSDERWVEEGAAMTDSGRIVAAYEKQCVIQDDRGGVTIVGCVDPVTKEVRPTRRPWLALSKRALMVCDPNRAAKVSSTSDEEDSFFPMFPFLSVGEDETIDDDMDHVLNSAGERVACLANFKRVDAGMEWDTAAYRQRCTIRASGRVVTERIACRSSDGTLVRAGQVFWQSGFVFRCRLGLGLHSVLIGCFNDRLKMVSVGDNIRDPYFSMITKCAWNETTSVAEKPLTGCLDYRGNDVPLNGEYRATQFSMALVKCNVEEKLPMAACLDADKERVANGTTGVSTFGWHTGCDLAPNGKSGRITNGCRAKGQTVNWSGLRYTCDETETFFVRKTSPRTIGCLVKESDRVVSNGGTWLEKTSETGVESVQFCRFRDMGNRTVGGRQSWGCRFESAATETRRLPIGCLAEQGPQLYFCRPASVLFDDSAFGKLVANTPQNLYILKQRYKLKPCTLLNDSDHPLPKLENRKKRFAVDEEKNEDEDGVTIVAADVELEAPLSVK